MRRLAAFAASSCLLVVLSGGMAASAAQVVDVQSGNFWFEDSTVGDGQIIIDAGDSLRVEVVEGTRHTVNIDGIVSSPPLNAGDAFTTPPINTPGTYTLYCRTHLNRGHKTTLVVLGDTTTTSAPTTTTSTPPTTTTTASTTTTSDSASTTAPATTTTTDSQTTVTTSVATPTSTSETTTTTSTGVDSRLSSDGNAPDVNGNDDPPENDLTAQEVPSGVVRAEGVPVWTRSVWVGLILLLPLTGLVAVILRRPHLREPAHQNAPTD